MAKTDAQPLVSCIMATKNRRRFIPQALRCFVRRSYVNAELVVVDDGDRPVGALCRDVPGVRYIRLTRPTPLGTKLNLGIEAARGDILQKIDDDDYYGPEFVATSARNIPRQGLSSTIVTRCCFLVIMTGQPTVWHSGHGWKPGGAFCFHRSLWRRLPFRSVDKSEDSLLLRDLQPRILRICDVEQYLVVRHGHNTWNWGNSKGVRMTANDYFSQGQVYPKPLERMIPKEDYVSFRRLLRWKEETQ
ncbi:MAG: glycosyltransferase family 2 protein [Bryobacteraceae bacterium]